jgi:hypothetical protein
MSYIEYFGGSYFLAWCSLWLFWMIVPLFTLVFRIINRVIRSINIIFRGWPPEHLDADGDFYTPEDNDSDEETSSTQAT